MKKLIAAALILSLVFSLSLTALAEENDTISFTDVAEDNWAWPGISFMVSHGYMNGTGDGAFNPWGEVSLGQALTIMARVAGETDKEGAPWYQIGFDWAEKSDAYTVPEDADLETLQIRVLRHGVGVGLCAATGYWYPTPNEEDGRDPDVCRRPVRMK